VSGRAASVLAWAEGEILGGDGSRTMRIWRVSASVGGAVAAGIVDHAEAERALVAAGEATGKDARTVAREVASGLRRGADRPWADRDLPDTRPPPAVRRRAPAMAETRAVAQACREAERYESAWALLSRKNLPPDLLHRLGIEIAAYHGRPALRWQVRTVDGQVVYRWRILRLPKARFAWSLDAAGEVPVGAVDALYGTRGLTGVPLLVNGESSVWACQAHGIRAVTMTLGEGAVSDRAVACIVAHAPAVDIAYDLDDVGRQGAERVAAAVVAAGGAARIIGLPEDLGKGGDVCDLLAQGRAKELQWRRQ
jgi:hypothetical protein